jgi:hypothetical protein
MDRVTRMLSSKVDPMPSDFSVVTAAHRFPRLTHLEHVQCSCCSHAKRRVTLKCGNVANRAIWLHLNDTVCCKDSAPAVHPADFAVGCEDVAGAVTRSGWWRLFLLVAPTSSDVFIASSPSGQERTTGPLVLLLLLLLPPLHRLILLDNFIGRVKRFICRAKTMRRRLAQSVRFRPTALRPWPRRSTSASIFHPFNSSRAQSIHFVAKS